MLPDENHLVPSSTRNQAFNKHIEVDPNSKFRVMIVPSNQRIFHHEIPHTHSHVVGARHHQVAMVRGEFHLPDRESMAIQRRDGHPVIPHIPNPNALVHRGGSNQALVVLVPIAVQDLSLVARDYHRGSRLAHIPNPHRAVAGGRGEDVGVPRVPRHRVDAVGVFLESTDAGGAVERPELDGVVPGGGDEGVAARGVVVHPVDFARVLLEGSERVLRRREVGVEELDGAVGDGGDEKGVVGFGPGEIVDAVGRVEGDDLGEGSGRGWGKGEDVDASVADDTEVLGGGDGEAILVEGAEFDGVAVERRFGDVHCRD
ncbi:unnamed protein product [Linum tenue]|uniref:Uncharacterized protein n=1 Tax=Linum tenue TaxID=586396 RepID=A0AAV0PZA0_9ROSI|nr:unnamed protein product [Linum tenue]